MRATERKYAALVITLGCALRNVCGKACCKSFFNATFTGQSACLAESAVAESAVVAVTKASGILAVPSPSAAKYLPDWLKLAATAIPNKASHPPTMR